MSHRLWSFLVVMISLMLAACSESVSPGVEHFAHAKTNLQTSDFTAAVNNLDLTIKNTNDESLKTEATLIRVALITAMADADQQMVAAYQEGAKQPLAQGKVGSFYKTRSDYANTARAYLMDAMQTVMDQRDKLDPNKAVAIEVPFPGFTGGTDDTLTKIKAGQVIMDAQRLNAEQQLTRNAFAKVLTALAGAGNDLNKGKGLYAAGKVNVDARAYVIELSDEFLSIGQIFDAKVMNDPDKLKTVNQVVEQNLVVATKLLAAKPDKDLEARVKKMQADCDKCLKKLKA